MDRKRLYDLCQTSMMSDGGEKQWEVVLTQEIEERKKSVHKLETFVLDHPENAELLERMRSEHLAPVFTLLNAPKDQLTLKMVAALLKLIDDVQVKKSWLSDLADHKAKSLLGARTSKSDFGGYQIAMFMTLYDIHQVFPIDDAVGLLIRTYRKMDPIHFFGLYIGTYHEMVDEHVSQMMQCASTGMLVSQVRYQTEKKCGV